MNISDTLEEYRAFLMGTLGSGTCDIYLRGVGRLMKHVGDKEAGDLSLKDFTSYKMALAKAGRKSGYIAGEISALCSYVEFLRKIYRMKQLDIEDLRDLRPKVRAGEPRPLEPWQYDELMGKTETIEESALVTLLYNTGLRINELGRLRCDSIYEREMEGSEGVPVRSKWLRILGKGNKERSVPLNKEAAEVLAKYMEFLGLKYPKGFERLFPGSYTMLWRKIRAIGQRAGIEVHPHMLRHTFATELLKRGENIVTIAKIMGHESLDTTRKYTKIIDPSLLTAVMKLQKER